MLPLVSVIVPIYNTEKYLEKTISSIINQDYDNLEILLVDDGSTDSSNKICDDFRERDSRIKVIHKSNAGVAYARNTALDMITGDFFCFIDGDDYVEKDYVSFLFKLISEKKADIAMGAYLYTWEDGRKERTFNKTKSDDYVTVESGISAVKSMLYGGQFFPSCWGKLYRKEKLGDIRFKKFFTGEDVVAAVEYYENADSVVFSNKPIYNYMQNENSVIHSVNPVKYYDMVLSGDMIYNMVTQNHPELSKAAAYYVIEKNMIVLMVLQSNAEMKPQVSHIWDNIKKFRKTVIFDRNANKRTRAATIISLFGIKTLCKVRNMITK